MSFESLAFNLNYGVQQGQVPTIPEGSQGAGKGLAFFPSAPCGYEMEVHGRQIPSTPILRNIVAARRRKRRRHKRELRRLRKLPTVDTNGRACYYTEEGARHARQQTGKNTVNQPCKDVDDKMEVGERASISGAELPIRVLQNIVIRQGAAINKLALPEDRPALPSPPSARAIPPAARYAFRDKGRRVFEASGLLKVELVVPQRELHARANAPPKLNTPQHDAQNDFCFTPGDCAACYPLTRLETGYYQWDPYALPPKTLAKRQRERDARHARYFRGTRAVSPTNMDELIDTLRGLPKAPATAAAPDFQPPHKRPENEQPRQANLRGAAAKAILDIQDYA